MTTVMELITQAYTVDDEVMGVPTYRPPTGTYSEIAAHLNAPIEMANPVTEAPQIPVPVTLKSVMALVAPAEMVAVYQTLPAFVADLKTAIDNQDREYMAGLLVIAATAGVIGAETQAALAGMLAATMADPSWTPTVMGPSLAAQAGLPPVTPEQVQTALGYWKTQPYR